MRKKASFWLSNQMPCVDAAFFIVNALNAANAINIVNSNAFSMSCFYAFPT